MKTLRYAFWGLVALCLIIVGLANRGAVTVRAMPESIANLLGLMPDVSLPLFIVLFIGFGAGLMVGFVWEWLREHKFRAEARAKGREVVQLKQQLSTIRDADGDGKDDVLQLIERSSAR